jgi:hypothetical protein
MKRNTHSSVGRRISPHAQAEQHLFIGDETRPMSKRIVDALVERTQVEVAEGPPLGYYVDLDAIDALYDTYQTGTRGDPPMVVFRYLDYQITVEDDRSIRITDVSSTEDGTTS